jgi:RNA polymerase sigma-70 factor (ECF subfamily)
LDNIVERELTTAAKDGDQNAIAQLVKEYSPKIYNLALRIMRNEEDAEDVLQETFLTMMRKLSSFRGESSLYTWLYRIGTNIALGKLREKKHMDTQIAVDGPEFDNLRGLEISDWPEHLEEKFDSETFQACLKQAMNDLPDHYRAVFVLRDLENMSTRESAKILDISEANVKVRLMRARLFLRDQIAFHLKCMEFKP